jgi:hypothetical protein
MRDRGRNGSEGRETKRLSYCSIEKRERGQARAGVEKRTGKWQQPVILCDSAKEKQKRRAQEFASQIEAGEG